MSLRTQSAQGAEGIVEDAEGVAKTAPVVRGRLGADFYNLLHGLSPCRTPQGCVTGVLSCLKKQLMSQIAAFTIFTISYIPNPLFSGMQNMTFT